MGGTRKLAAILVANIVGYSRLAGTDEDRTRRGWGLRSAQIDPAISSIGRFRSRLLAPHWQGCIIGTELGRNCSTSRGRRVSKAPASSRRLDKAL